MRSTPMSTSVGTLPEQEGSTLISQDGFDTAPRVSGTQWVLVSLCFAVALSGYLVSSYEGLRTLLLVLTLLSVVLVIETGLEALKSKVLGKVLLAFGTLGFFWAEGLSVAHREVPFSVPAALVGLDLQYRIETIQLGLMYVALFQLMLFVGYAIRPRARRLMQTVEGREDVRSVRASILRYGFVLAFIGPLLLSVSFDIRAATDALIAGRVAATGAEASPYRDVGLLNLVTFFGLFGASLLLAEALLYRSLTRVQKLVVAFLVIVPVILGGIRHLWLFIAVPVVLLAIRKSRKKVRPGQVVAWILFGLMMMVVVQLQYQLRSPGWRGISDVGAEAILETGITAQFDAMLVAEEFVPERHAYFLEPAEPYFVIHWIPRRFWPDKPIMESWLYYNDEYTQGATTYNVTPSIIGQFHINFGVLGVVYAGVFLGFLSALADRAMLKVDPMKQRAMAIAIGFFYAFIFSSFRFYSPFYFTYFAYAWIGMLLVTFKVRRRQTAEAPITPIPVGAGARS